MTLESIRNTMECWDSQLLWSETSTNYVRRLRIRFSAPIERPLLTRIVGWIGDNSRYLVEYVSWEDREGDLYVREVQFALRLTPV